MKNKRILIFVFALVAFIGLGIGYAALSDTITGRGEINTVDASNLDVTDSDLLNIVYEKDGASNAYYKATGTKLFPQGDNTREKPLTHDFMNLVVDLNNDTLSGYTISNMCVKGDKTTLLVPVRNQSTSQYSGTLTAKVVKKALTGNSANLENLNVSVAFLNPSLVSQGSTITIAPGELCYIQVTVVLEETLFSETLNASFDISFKAEAVDYGN